MVDAFDKQTGASPADEAKATELCPAENDAGLQPVELPDDAVADPSEADEVTGASPGTAQACTDLGLNSLEANLARFNIKPPGVL